MQEMQCEVILPDKCSTNFAKLGVQPRTLSLLSNLLATMTVRV